MTPRRTLLAALPGALLAPACTRAASPTIAPHPRLFATPDRVDRARASLAADAQGKAILAAVIAQADDLLKTAPHNKEFEAHRPVSLTAMRSILTRIQTLGIAHAFTGDARHATRGVAELLNLCAFPDWNPSHFLDVAEAGHAAAIGYDWFHAALTPEQRATVRDAIVDKSLRPARAQYDQNAFWTRATHNWNIVCNSGVTLAALAVLDDAPTLTGPLIDRALVNVRQGFSSYHRDGGWAEGPGYWQYATAYAIYLLAALESAGHPIPAELIGQPGLAETAGYGAHMTGPSFRVFNFADGGPNIRRTPMTLWLATRFNHPDHAWTELHQPDRPRALDALWYNGPAPAPTALDAAYPDIAVASFRSAWGDRNAAWLAIKGGDNRTNHSDLDLGTFLLEAHGQRFAAELGADDYALPGYFSPSQRYSYTRTASQGQNVLMVGETNQALDARAALVGFRSEPTFARCVIELGACYPGLAHHRGAALLDRRHVAIVDEFHPKQPTPLTWQMLTQAVIELQGTTARLTLGGQTLVARLIDPPDGCVFAEASAAAPPPEDPNTGFRRLVVRLNASSAQRLTVLFSPDTGSPPDLSRLRQPLANWTG